MLSKRDESSQVLPSDSVVPVTSSGLYYWLLILTTLVLVLPLWTVSMVPWVDYTDHLARIYIERYIDTVPVFSQYYTIKYELFPNLAIDLVGWVLLHWFDLDTTSRLFTSATVIVFAAGCHLFGTAVHRRPTWLAIPAIFFVFNSLVIYGFVNYIWSVSLFLIAGSSWIRFTRTMSVGRGVLATLLGLATYVAHLSGFFFLCLFTSVYTASDIVAERRIRVSHIVRMMPLLAGLLAYAFFRRSEAIDAAGGVTWSSVSEKMKHIWVLFSGYSTAMDAATAAGLLVVAVLAWRLASRWSMQWQLLVASAAFLACFLCFPTILHTGSDADTRFLPVAALLAILSVDVRFPGAQAARLVYALLLLVFTGRLAGLAWYWRQADVVSVEQRHLLGNIAENSTIYPLVFMPADRSSAKVRQHMIHLAGYATIDRHAISASTFTVRGQQPLRRLIPMKFGEALKAEGGGAKVNWDDLFSRFDYIWCFNGPAAAIAKLDAHCDLVASAGLGRLYRNRHQNRD